MEIGTLILVSVNKMTTNDNFRCNSTGILIIFPMYAGERRGAKTSTKMVSILLMETAHVILILAEMFSTERGKKILLCQFFLLSLTFPLSTLLELKEKRETVFLAVSSIQP